MVVVVGRGVGVVVREMGDPLGCWEAGVQSLREADFWRRTLLFRVGGDGDGDDGRRCGDASVVGIGMGCGRKGMGMMDLAWKSLEPSPW